MLLTAVANIRTRMTNHSAKSISPSSGKEMIEIFRLGELSVTHFEFEASTSNRSLFVKPASDKLDRLIIDFY